MVGYKERSFVEYIGDLRLRVTRIAILVGIVTVFCMTFSISFLYKYGQAIGVSTFFDIGEFIPFVMQSMIIFGLSYQLPIVMWAITASGIAEYTFWRRSLRYAVITFALFGAVVTPDGSGVTMWFVAGPMLLLYVLGMLIIETKNKEVSERH